NGTCSVAPGSPFTVPDNVPIDLQKGDFNSDGKLDLTFEINSDVKIWLGDGTGRITQSPAVVPTLTHGVPGDVNGDGKTDLVGMTGLAAQPRKFVTAALGNGSGGFTGTYTKEIRNFDYYDVQSIVTADFDRDGCDDVALIMNDNVFGNLIIVPSTCGGSASFEEPIYHSVPSASRYLLATDFNGDGKPDLGYLGGGARGVLYNTTAVPTARPPFDFDGDGKTDIGIFRPSGGEWWVNRSSNAQTFALQFGSSTDKITPADYTG